MDNFALDFHELLKFTVFVLKFDKYCFLLESVMYMLDVF